MRLDPCLDVRLEVILHAGDRRFRRLRRLHLPGDMDRRAVGAVLVGARGDAQRKRQGADRDERDPPRIHRSLQPVGSTFGGSPGVDKAGTCWSRFSTCAGGADDRTAEHRSDHDHACRQPAAAARPARHDEGAVGRWRSRRGRLSGARPRRGGGVRAPADGDRHRHRVRRRAVEVRLLHLCARAAGWVRAASAAAPHDFAAEVAAFPEYYEQYFQHRDAGGRGGTGGAAGVHRPDPLSRRGGAAARHRQPESRAGGRAARRGVHARGGAERRRRERTLQHRRGVLSRRGRRAAHGVPGDRRCGVHPADRRSVPVRPVRRSVIRCRAAHGAGGDLCRGAERQPARASRRSGCGTTRATASTTARASTRRRWPTSRATCCG